MSESFRRVDPSGVSDLLERADFPWWIAGGWALDLYLGAPIRPRTDIDVALLRRDQKALQQLLADWDLRVATQERTLAAWDPGRPLDPPLHAIWARPSGATEWVCEFLLNEGDDTNWLYRRDHRVKYPLASLMTSELAGIRVLPPEIVLLYKSKGPRATDAIDFEATLPALEAERVEWLRTALLTIDPRNPWIARLAETRG